MSDHEIADRDGLPAFRARGSVVLARGDLERRGSANWSGQRAELVKHLPEHDRGERPIGGVDLTLTQARRQFSMLVVLDPEHPQAHQPSRPGRQVSLDVWEPGGLRDPVLVVAEHNDRWFSARLFRTRFVGPVERAIVGPLAGFSADFLPPETTKGAEAPLVDVSVLRGDRCRSGAGACLDRVFCIASFLIRVADCAHTRCAQ